MPAESGSYWQGQEPITRYWKIALSKRPEIKPLSNLHSLFIKHILFLCLERYESHYTRGKLCKKMEKKNSDSYPAQCSANHLKVRQVRNRRKPAGKKSLSIPTCDWNSCFPTLLLVTFETDVVQLLSELMCVQYLIQIQDIIIEKGLINGLMFQIIHNEHQSWQTYRNYVERQYAF